MQCILDAWRSHETELLRFVRSRVADAETANDLVQEVFLRALRQPNGLCGVDHPRAWLFRVAQNLLIDRYRLSKDEVSFEEETLVIPETPPTPVDTLSECLPRVLSELSIADREAITLCDIGGMTQKLYSVQLGLTLPAAKARVQRARKRLKAHLVDACQVRFDELGNVCCFVPRPPLGS
jgi:RNA polymerase sigma-70 factor, ECF subfamily